MSERELKQQTIYNFVPTFMDKSLGPPCGKWNFGVDRSYEADIFICWFITVNLTHAFYTYADV